MNKDWYTSKTVLAAIATIIAVSAGFFGIDFNAIDQAAIVDIASRVVADLTAAFAIYGRVVATHKIGSADPGNPQSKTLQSSWMVGLLLGAMMLLPIAGCATFNDHKAATQLVVQYATLKVIERGSTPDDQALRASRIREIATEAKTNLQKGDVPLEALKVIVGERIAKYALSPADQLLANALVQAVMDELQARVGVGAIPPDTMYQAEQVLDWVITATGMVGSA